MTHNTQIYDIRHFIYEDTYLDTLLFSVMQFVLSLGQSGFDEDGKGCLKRGYVEINLKGHIQLCRLILNYTVFEC
jgi:hypothetical protein